MSKTSTNKSNNNNNSPLLQALIDHHVTAKVIDCDHHRIRGGLAVETDYIVRVTTQPQYNDFEAYTMSKTYSAFRTFAHQLKKVTTKRKKQATTSEERKLLKYCELVCHLIDAQQTSYLGKVNYMYVKVLAKERKQILDDVLSTTCTYFPSNINNGTKDNDYATEIANIIETFFLTDHVIDDNKTVDEDDIVKNNVDDNNNNNNNNNIVMDTSARQKHQRKASDGPLGWLSKGSNKRSSSSGDVVETTNNNQQQQPRLIPPRQSSIVVPMTRRTRASTVQRNLEDEQLNAIGDDAKLLMDDDRWGGYNNEENTNTRTQKVPDYSKPKPTFRSNGTNKIGLILETNPLVFVIIAILAITFLIRAASSVIAIDGDLFILTMFACFCIGLHTPRPMVGGFDQPNIIKGTVRKVGVDDRTGRKLLRRSIAFTSPTAATMKRQSIAIATKQQQQGGEGVVDTKSLEESIKIVAEQFEDLVNDEEEEEEQMSSPMPMFPEGAEIGTHLNCWSRPETSQFLVRGPNYLKDKKKIPSNDYIFPCRGLDLFLTDTCPENVGRNTGIMGGHLRDVPTFIINFRLPWGVLLMYAEIPVKFVQYIEANDNKEIKKKLLSELNNLTPPERTVARWLLQDDNGKNQLLKIVPVVVDGPWVVKSVVGGKPAIIGAKLPINYVYQPAENNDGKTKALYIEADLDIAASSAARGILSVTRSYTQILTLNLGFVIQANNADELPEQMLTGARLHGIDPLTAPGLPPMDDYDFTMLAATTTSPSEDDSV